MYTSRNRLAIRVLNTCLATLWLQSGGSVSATTQLSLQPWSLLNVIHTPISEPFVSRFNPEVSVAVHCDPFPVPAVDSLGDVSAGATTWDPKQDCQAGINGQTYAKSVNHNGRFGIMYAWFLPTTFHTGGPQHAYKYAWTWSVVWLGNPHRRYWDKIESIYSHGIGVTYWPNCPNDVPRLTVGYSTVHANEPVAFWHTQRPGTRYAIAEWDSLPVAARAALEEFGAIGPPCPLSRAHFQANVAEADALAPARAEV